jgi:hypothetical protein
MIIHHTRCLHKGITNNAAKKGEASFFHILAYCVGYFGSNRRAACGVICGLTIRHKAVQVFIKRPKLFLNL